MKRILLTIIVAIACTAPVWAQRGVMLNGEVSNKPRDIDIGLPAEDYGTLVLEDGLLSSSIDYPIYSEYHWSGGNAYRSQTLMSLDRVAIALGHMGYALDTRTRLGADSLNVKITLATSTFARIKADAAFDIPVGKRWSVAAGAYIDMDSPGTHPTFLRYNNKTKIFKLGLSRRISDGGISLFYKLSISDRFSKGGYQTAPFYYKGDGSIGLYNGFHPGKDNYFPTDDTFTFIDFKDGRERTERIRDLNRKIIHNVSGSFYKKIGDWTLDASVHLLYAPAIKNCYIYTAGIDQVDAGSPKVVTLPDGTPFTGAMQNRTINYSEFDCLEFMAKAEASAQKGRHLIRIGLDEMLMDHLAYMSTGMIAHTVEANPTRLSLAGAQSWGFNTGSRYMDGLSNCLSAYVTDEWSIARRLDFEYGLRLSVQNFSVANASNKEGETCNSRRAGSYLTDGIFSPWTATRTNFSPAAFGKLLWNIWGRLFFTAEEIYICRPRQMYTYFSAAMPSQRQTHTSLSMAGLQWNNSWMDVSTSVTYMFRNNLNTSVTASKQVGGVTETSSYLAYYSIGTLGWTSTINFHHKGFALNLLATLQDPRYRDYACDIPFSDGYAHYDYSGKILASSSRFLLEIDPSYAWNGLRVWLSARYYSRQYANRSNNVYFNGHWETFGGASYTIPKIGLTLAVDFVNILGQRGIKGKIDAADTIEDISILNDYLMAGTYILPFAANFSITYNF